MGTSVNWVEHQRDGGLPRIGGMATMPTRAHTLAIALDSILPQVDRLFLYFDKHERVPDFVAGRPKIVPLLPAQYGPIGGDGKLLGALLMGSPCLYFCFDDDIFYPLGYVELLASGLERHRFGALVGIHATRFVAPHLSYRRHRQVLHFSAPLASDVPVDEIGAGTLAFHSGRFRVDPRAWRYHTMGDLMVAIEGVRRGLPRIALRRPARFVMPLEEVQHDSLFRKLLQDDSLETAIMRRVLDEFPGGWTSAAPIHKP